VWRSLCEHVRPWARRGKGLAVDALGSGAVFLRDDAGALFMDRDRRQGCGAAGSVRGLVARKGGEDVVPALLPSGLAN